MSSDRQPTRLLRLDGSATDQAVIREAARLLREGQCVAFPTETVYGLGGSALSETAVAEIFAIKQRPEHNPLIVHVTEVASARPLVADWPALATRLTEHFWPGPLTIVLQKSAAVPDVVTAGGPTVALRAPSHPVAQALIKAADVPIAAPSANRATGLSPTTAQHVLESLGGRVPLILDGGPTSGGLESTVIDLTTDRPRILRPGLVTLAQLSSLIGPVDLAPADTVENRPARSPGRSGKHYAPQTPLTCVERGDDKRLGAALELPGPLCWVVFGQGPNAVPGEHTIVKLSDDPMEAAHDLYAKLYELDEGQFANLVVSLPPKAPEWAAIRDRLYRAANG